MRVQQLDPGFDHATPGERHEQQPLGAPPARFAALFAARFAALALGVNPRAGAEQARLFAPDQRLAVGAPGVRDGLGPAFLLGQIDQQIDRPGGPRREIGLEVGAGLRVCLDDAGIA